MAKAENEKAFHPHFAEFKKTLKKNVFQCKLRESLI